jgi:hypothetical protein
MGDLFNKPLKGISKKEFEMIEYAMNIGSKASASNIQQGAG